MPLVPCRDCGQYVSTDAPACPRCGAAAPGRPRTTAWVPCPRCGNANTRRIGPLMIGLAAFMSGGCLMWIPIIGWIAAPIAFLLGIGCFIAALIPSSTVSFQCQTCKHWFKVPMHPPGLRP